ncbi:MAG: hypothetical protein ABSG25_05710 [Bryobacteraceae bacterium]
MIWLLYLSLNSDEFKNTLKGISIFIFVLCFSLLMFLGLGAIVSQPIGEATFVWHVTSWTTIFFSALKSSVWCLIVGFIFMILATMLPTTRNFLILLGVSKFIKIDIFKNSNELTKNAIKLLSNKIKKLAEEK